jgi:hypothetical protein
MLLGEIETVQAVTSNAVRGFAVEDTAAALLTFESGIIGTLLLSDSVSSPWSWETTSGENTAFPKEGQDSILIGGTRGSLSIPSLDLRWHEAGAESWLNPLTHKRVPVVPAEIPALAGLQNPGISTQPRHFFVVDAGLKNKLDAGQIQAMFMAMYRGKMEAGIVGWAFTSEAAAEEGKRIVERRHAREPERIGVYRAGKTVIWVWRDGRADDELFAQLKQHVKTQVLSATK